MPVFIELFCNFMQKVFIQIVFSEVGVKRNGRIIEDDPNVLAATCSAILFITAIVSAKNNTKI